MLRAALIGLGRMGHPMARSLLRAGVPLTVYNRTPGRLPGLEGATVAGSPADAAANADVLITTVSDAAAGRAVLGDLDGPAGLVVCEMSTIGPVAARALAAELAER